MTAHRRRRVVLFALSLSGALLVAGIFAWVRAGNGTRSTAEGLPARPRVPRVILLTIDTLRADVLACYGNPSMVTATLSSVSRNAILFEQATAPSPWTRPSVACLHTGLPPKVHGALAREIEVEAVLPSSVPALAERMRDAGYVTAGMGYNAFIAFSPNFKRGFREFAFFPMQVTDSEGNTVPVASNVGGLKLHGSSVHEMQTAVDTIGSTPVLTQLAVQWITDHAQDDFFLWLHYFDPHSPYTPSRDYFSGRVAPMLVSDEHYAAWAIRLNEILEDYLSIERKILKGTATPEETQTHQVLRTELEAKRPSLRKLYEAEVEFVDQAIGEVLQALQRLGLYEDTLLIVTSDHGEEFWDHGHLEHGHSLKQELLHVPLLIKPPRHRGAVRVADRVSIESVLPTVLELCSLPRPSTPGLGPSLASTWVRPGGGSAAAPLFATGILYGKAKEAVLFGDMKYILEPASGEEQLYDLVADPREQDSLVLGAPPALEEGRRLLRERNRTMRELHGLIWRGGVKTTAPDEVQRKVLRDHGYIK